MAFEHRESQDAVATEAPGLLLVEHDDVAAERMLSLLDGAWLSDLGVERARTVAEAELYLRDHSPACALVALSFPDADGFDVVDRMRQADAELPLVLLAVPEEETTAAEAVSHAAQEYVLKDSADAHVLSRAIRWAIDRARSDLQAAYEATHDPITGLANRAYLMHDLELALSRSQQTGRPLALVVIDLDDVHLLAESLGHGSVDELLFEVGVRLQDAVRPDDVLVRFGPDQFAVMCRHVRDDAEATAVARRLADRATAEPFVTGGVEVLVRLSIGVTVARAGERASDVASHAESAAERVRSSGGGSVAAYRHEMRDAALHRLHTRSGLRRALEQGELEVYYQPQFTLADRRPFGAEALLRWRDPEHGLRGPGEFIAVAEETGLIAPIGLFVLDQACADLLTWGASADGSPGPVVSVNVSMRQLADPDLPQSVEAALAASGVAPESLCLEVTETVAMETAENMVRVLGDLQRLGVRLALDDFGTGYSSLSYLDRLPIDVLKLDRTFVAGVDHDARKRRIVAAVTGLAQGLGMRWLAEGVEREEEADALEGLGCELVQGFLFGRPAPAAETRELFARGWT